MKVLVTGANGFIGKEIVGELFKNNFEVIQLGRRFTDLEHKIENSKISNNSISNNLFEADITDYKNLVPLENIKTVFSVVHAAGLAHQFGNIEPERFNTVNVSGTRNILRLALKLKTRHFILISSTAVYGIKKNRGKQKTKFSEIDELTVCAPETAYAESKLEAELTAIEFCEKNGIPLTILRLAPVIGEANTGNVARLIETIDKGRFVWIGKGQNFKSLIYKNDVARACAMILDGAKKGTEIFNLSAEPIEMKEFVSIISLNLGRKIPNINIPPLILDFGFMINARLFGIKKINSLTKTVEKWLSDDVYSINKIAETYSFYPATTVRKGVEKQIEHYKAVKRN